MDIGVPKEIKNHEYRVGLTPAGVRQLVEAGHRVVVQRNAGAKIGFSDDLYHQAGATLVEEAADIYACSLVVKVKEPLPSEYPLLRRDQTLFCFLHLAPDPEQAKHLVSSGVTAIAYETVTDAHGKLPLLAPMSEIAGRLAVQVGATYLQLNHGGRGILLGGVPGVLPGRVVVLGGGAGGTEAARIALGMGALVTVIDRDLARLRQLDALYGPRLQTLYSTAASIEEAAVQADVLIGAVLVAGKMAPKLVTRDLVAKMLPGSVLIDLSIDQGGISTTSLPTSHADPTYVVDDVIHYCVTNMPGACARSATLALTHATLSYVLALANHGVKAALQADSGLMAGLNVYDGHVTHPAVAHDLGYTYVAPEQLF